MAFNTPAGFDAAVQRYRSALLEMAAGDLMARKAGTPQTASAAASAQIARRDLLDCAKNLSVEQFTAALMAAGFLRS